MILERIAGLIDAVFLFGGVFILLVALYTAWMDPQRAEAFAVVGAACLWAGGWGR